MAAGSSQQASQAILVSALAEPLDAAWSALLNVENLQASLPQFTAGVQALVTKYGQASASIAASYYAKERLAAGVRGNYTVFPAPPAAPDVVTKGVEWATKGLWSAEPDVAAAKTNVLGVAERYTLDAGRSTIIDAVKADRKAKAWARVIEPGACSFCLLLATRGAVYRTEKTGGFRSHDHCRCHVEPVFNAYEPSAEIRRAQAIYQSVKGTARGPVATRRAFRRAIESQSPNLTPGG